MQQIARIALALSLASCATGPTEQVSGSLQSPPTEVVPEEHLSRTAIIAALLRSVGAGNPNPAFRNPDHLAGRFVGPGERALIARWPMLYLYEMDYETAVETHRERTGSFETPMAAHFVRTRRIDELLVQAVQDGARQVVILGAGFDSRAYRLQDSIGAAHVYELDLPETQSYKMRRVQEVVGKPPDNVVYVSIDFTKQDLRTVLREAGYREDQRTFFIWEGVTYYLPREAVELTLSFIGSHSATGSEVVFDYADERAITGEHDDARLVDIVRRAAAFGEPWLFGLSPDDAGDFLAAQGLHVLSDLGKSEIDEKYLTDGDGVPVDAYPWWWRICQAAVR